MSQLFNVKGSVSSFYVLTYIINIPKLLFYSVLLTLDQ